MSEIAASSAWTQNLIASAMVHAILEQPHARYCDCPGTIKPGCVGCCAGRKVVALSRFTAAIESVRGAITIYRKHNNPAVGPIGDSLDDLG